MIAAPLLLLVCGIALSAYFSGSETGFYRASRTRLVLDAMDGDRVSRQLMYFVNHPTTFVATALVGNNVANYLVSLSIVLLTRTMMGAGVAAETGASFLLSPVIFVYGELLPKSLFYQAPNLLLRQAARIFWLFAIVFAPITAFLRVLGLGLEKILGQSPTRVRLALAKKELAEVLLEGEAAGILQPAQLEMSKNFFEVATRPVTDWMIPVTDMPKVTDDMSRSTALQYARQLGLELVIVDDAQTGLPIGYLKTVEMTLGQEVSSLKRLVRPLLEITADTLHGELILMMQTNRTEMAGIIDTRGKIVGILRRADLLRPLLPGSLASIFDEPSRQR